MPILRLTQSSPSEGHYRIEVALEADGLPRQIAVSHWAFHLTPQDQEDVRWYLEDYLQYPSEPALNIATRIERRLYEIGTELFRAVFQSNDDARDLWATLRTRLHETRIEIATDIHAATAIPWELLHDPKTDTPLALRARAFVRTLPQAAQRPYLPPPVTTVEPGTKGNPIRILLVICRPDKGDDVPFRSVASRILRGLGEHESQVFQLDVLRPPTFEQLGRVLRRALSDGQPYHVVHFDGHGIYADVAKQGVLAGVLRGLSPQLLAGLHEGTHGYLLFENPERDNNVQPVGGQALGKLLVETSVPVLVLNACRSAHAEAPEQPETASTDSHTQVRAFGSLALQVMDQGVATVVAMRYNVYVVTAAQFVTEMYANLIRGYTLGEAVTLGRKNLADEPMRIIAYNPVHLQDWLVPIIYEAAPLALFPKLDGRYKFAVKLHNTTDIPRRGHLAPELPARPDVGFFGRDETLLALDRALDRHHVILLHGYAGSGKTSTVVEFARWYTLTGGVDGPVLFTSFEQHKPLSRVLDQIGTLFSTSLERSGIHWLTLTKEQRRGVALQVMRQVPILWIWDNVETIAGFPTGTNSAWSNIEQLELSNFLREAAQTKAKFLLTSRRDEQSWLGALPARILMPPMPMQERLQMAQALAKRHGHHLTNVADWRPLLRFTEGNPLTITVLVGQAIRDGLKTKDQILQFVTRLRAGESVFQDETSEGRSKSLGASLSYGFEHSFNEAERRQLALLHFFREHIYASALGLMGEQDAPWCLHEVRGLSREERIALLDRAAEVGLLTSLGSGVYSIHPTLPWFFYTLFKTTYAGAEERATRAFAEAMGMSGVYAYNEYRQGNNRENMIGMMLRNEMNFLHARQLALANAWWSALIKCMRGLRYLYTETNKGATWKALVEEIVPFFVDPVSDAPLPGRENGWRFVMEYRASIAQWEGNLEEAQRLLGIALERERKEASAALALDPKDLTAEDKTEIENVAVDLQDLGMAQMLAKQPACAETLHEALLLRERIGFKTGIAICAGLLCKAYMNIPQLEDLDEAEYWCKRALENLQPSDRKLQAECIMKLGEIAYERFRDAVKRGSPESDWRKWLDNALREFKEALKLQPLYAGTNLSDIHNHLGNVYSYLRQYNQALTHFQQSVRLKEHLGQMCGAARTRLDFVVALLNAGRAENALEYARVALDHFKSCKFCEDYVQTAEGLIAHIKLK